MYIIAVTKNDTTLYVTQAKGDYILVPEVSKALQFPSSYSAKVAGKHLPNKVTRGGSVWILKTPQ